MKNLAYLLGLIVVVLGFYAVNVTLNEQRLQHAVYNTQMDQLTEASETLQQLQNETTQALLFKEQQAANESLYSVWRLSSNLNAAITKLPLQDEVAASWSSYISKLGEQAKMATKSKDEKWREHFQQAKESLRNLSNQWMYTTAVLYENNRDFKNWEKLMQQKKTTDNFNTQVTSLNTYEEKNFPLTASEQDYEKKRDLQNLLEKDVSREEVVTRFKQLFPELKEAIIQTTVKMPLILFIAFNLFEERK